MNKKYNRNSLDRQKPKVDFIKENFNMNGINVYLNRPFLVKVKDALFEAGFYSPSSRECLNDESIIKLCLKAQGIQPGKRTR